MINEIIDLDMSFFVKAEQSLKDRKLDLALNEVQNFKNKNNLVNFTLVPYKIALLEIVLHFQLANVGDTNYFISCGKLTADYLNNNPEIKPVEVINLLTIMGECFCRISSKENALSTFEKILSIDENNHLIRMKSLVLAKELQKISKARIIGKQLLEVTCPYYIPALFVFFDLAIFHQNKILSLKYIDLLIKVSETFDISQLHRLFSGIINISEYEKAYEFYTHIKIDLSAVYQFDIGLTDIYLFRKDYKSALSCLAHINSTDIASLQDRKLIESKRAKAFAGIKDYEQAFKYFSLSADLQEQLCFEEVVNQGHYNNYQVKCLDIDLIQLNEKIKVEQKIIPLDQPIIFNIGFPRSGTTLLDTVLDTQPVLQTLTEIGAIDSVIIFMHNNLNKRYPEDLLQLTSEEIKQLRHQYLTYVVNFLEGADISVTPLTTLVDKMPTNTRNIPLILCLFPNAKFIVSLRHPMDCTLSLFQQDIVSNSLTTDMTTLKACVKCYIDMFNAFEYCQKHLDFSVHFVKYEDLITNFEQTTNKIFDFIGVDNIDPSYLTFNESAKDRIINTCSKDQVTQGLYQTSLYKWLNYKDELTESLLKLKPCIEKLGYAS